MVYTAVDLSHFQTYSVVDAEFAPTTHGILVARLPSKLWHIMIYLSPIITAYGASCVEQTGK